MSQTVSPPPAEPAPVAGDENEPLTLPKLADAVSVHRDTIHAWHTDGVRTRSGQVIKLFAVRVGSRLKSTVAAVREFSVKWQDAMAHERDAESWVHSTGLACAVARFKNQPAEVVTFLDRLHAGMLDIFAAKCNEIDTLAAALQMNAEQPPGACLACGRCDANHPPAATKADTPPAAVQQI